MSSISKLAVYREVSDQLVPLKNDSCPIWVEGGLGPTNFSELEFSKVLSTEACLMLNSLQLDLSQGFVPSDKKGRLFKLSFADVEVIRTICQNYFLPPWKEARLSEGPNDADASDTKALLVWLAYWTEFGVNAEEELYLYLEIDLF